MPAAFGLLSAIVSNGSAAAQAPPAFEQTDPRYGLLTPIPDHGAVPPIVEMMRAAAEPTRQERDFRAESRRYARQVRAIRHEFLGDVKVARLRAQGIAALCELTDPAAFRPLVEETRREEDDVRLAVMDHLAAQGDRGQAALARMAVYEEDQGMRHQAGRRLTRPASDAVLAVLDEGLRSTTHAIANRAGTVSGALGALQTIPLLIFAQATADPVDDEGDLAWIAVGTQEAFVARVEPVVGSGAGAFQPIPGVVSSGTILRVVDAVAIFYRTEVHRVLVQMTTDDWGEPTAGLGYDIRAWWEWYNGEYLPYKNRQITAARLAEQAEG